VSQFPGGGPDFITPGRPGYKAQKSRGVYLKWLDDQIDQARKGTEWHGKEFWTELRTLESARKAFTDEFYPK
jgi:hypothetical protein